MPLDEVVERRSLAGEGQTPLQLTCSTCGLYGRAMRKHIFCIILAMVICPACSSDDESAGGSPDVSATQDSSVTPDTVASTDTDLGSEDASSNEARAYYGSKQPGDVVRVTIDETTMTLENVTLDETLVVTIGADLAGFRSGTFDGGAGTGLFLEMAGQGVLALGGYDDSVVVGSAVGACPTEDSLSFNYLFAHGCDYSPDSDGVVGVLTMTATETGYDLELTAYTLAGAQDETLSLPGATCEDGVFSVPDTDITFGVTPAGFLVGDHGPGEGAGAGFPVPDTAPTAGDIGSVEVLRGFLSKAVPSEEEGVDVDVLTIPGEAVGTGSGLDGFAIDAFNGGTREGPYPFVFEADRFSDLPGVLGGNWIDRDFLFITGEVDGQRLLYGATFEVVGPEEAPEGTDLTGCEEGTDPEEPDREVYINPLTLFLVEQ